jgi:capsular polysaccharide transport system permease protein
MKSFGRVGAAVSFPMRGGLASRWSSALDALRRWSSLILQVAVREFDARFGYTRFGVLLALAEPFLLVLLIVLLRSVLRIYAPPFGTSAVIFYSSGIFPYFVFLRLSLRSLRAGGGGGRRLPGVTRTMALIGTTLAESALILSSLIIWFTGLYLYGLEAAAPFHIGSCLAALAGLWLIGFGIGLCNASLIRYFPLWVRIWRRMKHPLMLLSGVFFIVDILPYEYREFAVWNPLVHGIVWFRWGLYGNYPILILDIGYFLGSAAVMFFIGVIVFWSTIRVAR